MSEHDNRGPDAAGQAAAEPGAAEPSVAGPQSEAAVVAPEAYVVSLPPVLSSEQRAILSAALDRIVPAREGLAGAGGLGVGDVVEQTLAATPALRRLFFEGLAEIVLAAARQAGTGSGGGSGESASGRGPRDLAARPGADAGFAALDGSAQDDVLRAVEAAHPAFFAALVEHTYRGYYICPDVHAAIGYASRPPQPLGYALTPFEPELLVLQRDRAPFWRPA